MYSLKELQPMILSWANDKGLLKVENAPKQRLKLLEELGETAKAILQNNEPEIKDGLGDTFVVLIILHAQLKTGYDFSIDRFLEKAEDLNPATRMYRIVYYDDCNGFDNLNYLCLELGYDLTECANLAWNEIKDRTGKNVGGTFIKD